MTLKFSFSCLEVKIIMVKVLFAFINPALVKNGTLPWVCCFSKKLKIAALL